MQPARRPEVPLPLLETAIIEELEMPMGRYGSPSEVPAGKRVQQLEVETAV